MAFAAVTILMDTLQQHFLQPKHRFPLRNKTKVTSLYCNLSFLQKSLEQDSEIGKYGEAMKDLEAQLRDTCVELRFQIEQQLSSFYLGRAMKIRLQSAQKLVPVLNRSTKNKKSMHFRSLLDALVKHFALPVSRMPAHIQKRIKSFGKLRFTEKERNDEALLLEAKIVIKQELKTSYLKRYMKQRNHARQRIHQIFTDGTKLTTNIKKEFLKMKGVCEQSKNSQKHNAASVKGFESESITVGSSQQQIIKMVGCDDQFNTIMDIMNRYSSKREIVSIVGMGGIGKTTLAKRIYDNASVISHYDCRAWVTISQEYNPKQVFQTLLHSLGSGNNAIDEPSSNDQLAELVYQSVKHRRYLVVIDDIWSIEVWGSLCKCLPDDKNGSRMLLTTRLKSVAECASSGGNFLHNMRFLNSYESWNLFHNKASKRITFSSEFEKIIKEIVDKCKGLPLAISVAAGLLSNSKQNFNEWKHIAKNISALSLDHSNKQCTNILNLSYTFLPHHLKLCFLSFGAFPEDYEVPLDMIVYFWVSEGFLKVVSSKSLEDVARECIEDLVDRNLVQMCNDEKLIGKINGYRMHDVLRELALREAKKESLLPYQEDDVKGLMYKIIQPINYSHKAKQGISSGHHLNNFTQFSTSFFMHSRRWFQYPLGLVCGNFRLLRVLVIDCVEISDPRIFTEIMSLFHLRCLVVGTTLNIHCLPWFMLWNLQKLRVYNRRLQDLHRIIWGLPQLRHLYLSSGMALAPPRSIQDNLESIRWLDYRSCTKELFVRTPNLTKLGVYNSKYIGKCKESNWYENLSYLYKLQELQILDKIIHWGLRSVHSMEILSRNAFLPNLKKLTLRSTDLEWKDINMIGMFPKLEVLKLDSAVHGSKWESRDGGFRQLKHLVFDDLDLQHWEATSRHFPVLEGLTIIRCYKLEEIPSGFADIATLQSIEVHNCSESVITSAKNIRNEQQEFGNDPFVITTQHYYNENFICF